LTLGYLSLLLVAYIILLAITVGLAIFAFQLTWQRILDQSHFRLVIYLVAAVPLLLFDRFLDERFRKLEKMADEKTVA